MNNINGEQPTSSKQERKNCLSAGGVILTAKKKREAEIKWMNVMLQANAVLQDGALQ